MSTRVMASILLINFVFLYDSTRSANDLNISMAVPPYKLNLLSRSAP